MLSITRDSGYADRLRAYEVILDGKVVGDIPEATTKSFQISPGPHTLYLKIDYIRSNKVNFEHKSNEALKFVCRNNIRGKKVLLWPLYLTVLRNKYITLAQVDKTTPS